MTAFKRFISGPFGAEQSNIIYSLVLLRLVVCVLCMAVVAVAHFYFQKNTDLIPIYACLIIVIGWSLFLVSRQSHKAGQGTLIRELLLDYAWVLVIVLLSGRSANPFIYYYLVLMAVSATVLPSKKAWLFCLLANLIYSFLLASDIKQHFEHFSSDYRLHLLGMWINFVGSTVVACFFVVRLSRLLRLQQAELAVAREDNLKDEQLVALATVAASTVHNLATPISTLTVLSDELLQDSSIDKSTKDDLALMQAQIVRCRSTMDELSDLAQHSNDMDSIKVEDIIRFLCDHYALHRPGKQPIFVVTDTLNEASICCNTLFKYAVINLINNAIESTNAIPSIKFVVNEHTFSIVIENDTPSSEEELLHNWGKPSASNKSDGLGIGSFLANSTIEKQGGEVELTTHAHGESETLNVNVEIRMPLTVSKA